MGANREPISVPEKLLASYVHLLRLASESTDNAPGYLETAHELRKDYEELTGQDIGPEDIALTTQ